MFFCMASHILFYEIVLLKIQKFKNVLMKIDYTWYLKCLNRNKFIMDRKIEIEKNLQQLIY